MKLHEWIFPASKSQLTSGLAAISASLAIALLTGCAGGEKMHGNFQGPVGLQLYSVRNQLGRDIPGTLAEVRGWGVKFVELAGNYNMKPAEFKSQLDGVGLDAVSGHFPYERFRDDPEGVAREALDLGLVYIGCAWIPHTGEFDEKTCRDAIAVFNHAGEVLAKHHMTFFYHTHGYEFQPFNDGRLGTLFDLLVTGTNPEFVRYEMDVFWIFHAGQDPVKLMKRYPDRFELMHLKDMRPGTKTGLLTGGTDVRNDVALGTGMIPLPAILREAQKIGIKWYFIEDESPSSMYQIPKSLRYLHRVNF